MFLLILPLLDIYQKQNKAFKELLNQVQFQNTEATQITLSQVDETQVFTIIDISVKVVSCGEPVTLGTRQKQEVKVGDATGCGLVQLWEQNIGLLTEGRSYELKHIRIVEYENIKSIAM